MLLLYHIYIDRPTYGPEIAKLFKWWVKFKVVDRKKKKTRVKDVIILTRRDPSSAEICAKSKKKFTSEIPSFPSSMPGYGETSFSLLR